MKLAKSIEIMRANVENDLIRRQETLTKMREMSGTSPEGIQRQVQRVAAQEVWATLARALLDHLEQHPGDWDQMKINARTFAGDLKGHSPTRLVGQHFSNKRDQARREGTY